MGIQTMNKKRNWEAFKTLLDKHGIKKLYHFTDRDNLESIIRHGGLYSWGDCEDKGIKIAKPGGGMLSRELDSRDRLQHYVRVSFTTQHPMMYVAMQDGRLSNPVILEIDPEVIYWQDTKFSDMNATRTGASKGSDLKHFEKIHFSAVKARRQFDLSEEEQPYFQAEVLVKNFIPLERIMNIGNFGIPMPAQPTVLQSKDAYTAQITRNTPTAFIFLVDQSVSMKRHVTLNGEQMTLAECVARIVNNQINELVLRCIKTSEVRHYYDIAMIGYGHEAYSGWGGKLEGRDFVSPEELKNNPYKRITVREEKHTRKGVVIKEVEKVQWLEARHDGHWTHLHLAFKRAEELLHQWLEKHKETDCYPPTIIHITDGEFNHATREELVQQANELKSLFTNDGNVLLWNIHVTPNGTEQVLLPTEKGELSGDRYAELLYDMSSLLPTRYNAPISDIRGDQTDARHVAMSMNVEMATLIQLMDIGTPTNISKV
ncbi:MAG: DUF4433 domain-containing protein [Prevotella sp.]|nr:DUF4433 domain-containing protein [Prevotella sp.]